MIETPTLPFFLFGRGGLLLFLYIYIDDDDDDDDDDDSNIKVVG